MTKTAIFPHGSKDQTVQIKVSHGIVSGDYVFLTGVNSSRPDGSMPESSEDQIRNTFIKIGAVLTEAGLALDAIVEMTTYHIGLKDHFVLFNEIRSEYGSDPFPACTAF